MVALMDTEGSTEIVSRVSRAMIRLIRRQGELSLKAAYVGRWIKCGHLAGLELNLGSWKAPRQVPSKHTPTNQRQHDHKKVTYILER